MLRDVALLAQTEVLEISVTDNDGTSESTPVSSARHPVAASIGLSSAALTPGLLAAVVAGQIQEHEGAPGGGQAQAVTALLLATSGALAAVVDVAQRLDIDADRMRKNVEITQGLIVAEAVALALGAKLGMQEAHEIVDEAARRAIGQRLHLSAVLADDPRVNAHMTPGELARLFESMGFQGVAQTFIDRLIGSVGPRTIKRSG
jgi:3-carboxy-cis,cis-muconate cycloisomerase